MGEQDLGKIVGSILHRVTDAPAADFGLVQDWALNTVTGDLYEKTDDTTWELRMNIRGAANGFAFRVTLEAAQWENGRQTVQDENFEAGMKYVVAASTAAGTENLSACGASGVKMLECVEGQATFACETVPDVDVVVDVLRLDVEHQTVRVSGTYSDRVLVSGSTDSPVQIKKAKCIGPAVLRIDIDTLGYAVSEVSGSATLSQLLGEELADYSLFLNGVEIGTFDGASTLGNVLDAINSSIAGVTVALDFEGNAFVFTADEVGDTTIHITGNLGTMLFGEPELNKLGTGGLVDDDGDLVHGKINADEPDTEANRYYIREFKVGYIKVDKTGLPMMSNGSPIHADDDDPVISKARVGFTTGSETASVTAVVNGVTSTVSGTSNTLQLGDLTVTVTRSFASSVVLIEPIEQASEGYIFNCGSGGGDGVDENNLLVVHITKEDNVYSSDTSTKDIYEAWEAGKVVIAYYDNVIYPLMSVDREGIDASISYYATFASYLNGTYVEYVFNQYNDNRTYVRAGQSIQCLNQFGGYIDLGGQLNFLRGDLQGGKLASLSIQDDTLSVLVQQNGEELAGNLAIADPTEDAHAATKKYVDENQDTIAVQITFASGVGLVSDISAQDVYEAVASGKTAIAYVKISETTPTRIAYLVSASLSDQDVFAVQFAEQVSESDPTYYNLTQPRGGATTVEQVTPLPFANGITLPSGQTLKFGYGQDTPYLQSQSNVLSVMRYRQIGNQVRAALDNLAVADPKADSHAATKKYVDEHAGGDEDNLLFVHITQEDGVYSSDTSAKAIYEAWQDGKIVIAIFEKYAFHLRFVESRHGCFTVCFFGYQISNRILYTLNLSQTGEDEDTSVSFNDTIFLTSNDAVIDYKLSFGGTNESPYLMRNGNVISAKRQQYFGPGDFYEGFANLAVADPTEDDHAATKRYVDEHAGGGDAAGVAFDSSGITGLSANNVQSAIEQTFTSVSNGKAAVASAITGMGVDTDSDATFEEMAANIINIATATPTLEVTLFPPAQTTVTATHGSTTLTAETDATGYVQIPVNAFGQWTVSVALDHYVPATVNVSSPAAFDALVQVAFDPVLNNNTWDAISFASSLDVARDVWDVGDTKTIHVEGLVGTYTFNHDFNVYILEFDHNWALEGKGISFGCFKNADGVSVAIKDGHYMRNTTGGSKWFNTNHWGSLNYGGWSGCDKRYDILGSTDKAPSGYGAAPTTTRVGYNATVTCATNPVPDTLMAAFPVDLRAVMKPINKYTDNKGNASNVSVNVTKSVDYLPEMAEFEVFGERKYANQYEKNKQTQYTYYAVGNSPCKHDMLSPTSWTAYAIRSPYFEVNYSGISSNGGQPGSMYGYNVEVALALAPVFLV